MTFKYVRVDRPAQFVVHVELNRPNKLNAFLPELWIEVGQIFTQLSHASDVRAIVLSGAGERAFTAGLDIDAAGAWMGEMLNLPDTARRTVYVRRHIASMQACLTAIEQCEKPVICAMHGVALGMAVDIACCTDIRVCAADTRFAVKEVDIGLAADLGSLARLPKIVGSASWVREVSLTARDFFAAEAQTVGFVSRVLPSKAATVTYALDLAILLAAKSPVAIHSTKELLNHARDHSVTDTLRYTAAWNAAAVQSEDVQAALLSGKREKRPQFAKL